MKLQSHPEAIKELWFSGSLAFQPAIEIWNACLRESLKVAQLKELHPWPWWEAIVRRTLGQFWWIMDRLNNPRLCESTQVLFKNLDLIMFNNLKSSNCSTSRPSCSQKLRWDIQSGPWGSENHAQKCQHWRPSTCCKGFPWHKSNHWVRPEES